MKTASSPRKRLGRPPTNRPLKRPVNVMLDPRVAEGLRAYGAGNLSGGVALAAQNAGERVGAKRALPDVRAAMAGEPRTLEPRTDGKSTRKPDGLGAGRPLGRPLVGVAPRVRTTIQLYPAVVEQLRFFGDGVVAQGIERAAVLVRAVRLEPARPSSTTNHPNRNWKRRWQVDCDAGTAAHESGLNARFHRLASGDWRVNVDNGPETIAALLASGEPKPQARVERLIWEAHELFRRALDRRLRNGG